MIEKIMNRNIIVMECNSKLVEISEKMKKDDIGMIILCDNKKIKGIITDRDIVTKIIANNDTEIKDYYSNNIVSIDINENIDKAIELMKNHKIKRLLVKNKNKLVGVLSLSDLLNFLDNDTIAELVKTIFSINRNDDKYITTIDEFEL